MHSQALFWNLWTQSFQQLCVVFNSWFAAERFCQTWALERAFDRWLYGLLFLFTYGCKLILTTNKSFRNLCISEQWFSHLNLYFWLWSLSCKKFMWFCWSNGPDKLYIYLCECLYFFPHWPTLLEACSSASITPVYLYIFLFLFKRENVIFICFQMDVLAIR